MVYSVEVALLDSASAPTILVSRSGGDVGNKFALGWEFSNGQLRIDGKPLSPTSEPILYYKADNILKTVEVIEADVWLPLFSPTGPTVEDLQRVFARIETR